MRVGYISSDFSTTLANIDGSPVLGGACHYRCHLPAKYLTKNGIEAVLSEHFVTKNGVIHPIDFQGKIHDCDVIVFQRWMVQGADQVILRARAAGQIVLQDVDDYFWGLNPSNLAWFNTHPKYNAVANLDHYWKALNVSSGVTVSTPYLLNKLNKLDCPIYVLENAVELSAFTPNVLVSEKPVLGWTGSTLHRSGDLEILKGIIGPFLEKHDLQFFHLGEAEYAPKFSDLAGLAPERLRTAPLCSMDRYPAYFALMDVEVVPLAQNSFNFAKSALKGLEAAASGVPFLSSSSPEYDELGFGIVCKRPRDWVRNLEMILDTQERISIAKKNLELVQAFDIETRWQNWADLYQTLTN